MEFRIADTFTASLARLTSDEQKAVKNTAFDLQLNPAHPSLSFHKLDRARDKNFWSVRVNSNIRLIIHKTEASFLLCYVDHHDEAYTWAERRKLEVHPRTGAAQFVEIRETVQEVLVPVYISKEALKPTSAPPQLFASIAEDILLSYGVPVEWLLDVKLADEDSLLTLVDHLPAEAAEALLELAIGGVPKVNQSLTSVVDPFEHPDALRRFRTLANIEELERALDYPWDKWAVFLHPDQRDIVERDYSGPVRVSGSAGTGKTIVALHRAVYLARQNPNTRILLTTFSDILANALKVKLRRLINNEPHLGERIDVESINKVGLRLYKFNIAKVANGSLVVATPTQIADLLSQASNNVTDHKFSSTFLYSEWEQVVDAWQLKSWEAYRDVKRLGRKTKLPENQRAKLWTVFEQVINTLKVRNHITLAELFTRLVPIISSKPPYDYVVVDEAQDITVYHLRMLAAIGAHRSNTLFFAGDARQRIFQQPFSWKALGVSIQGRSKTLTVNYRTSHQIRKKADQLLDYQASDVDGNADERNKTISVFNGPAPHLVKFDTPEEEATFVGNWIAQLHQSGLSPHEIGIFVRSEQEIERAKLAARLAGIPFIVLDEHVETISTKVAVSTMHLAKGLEFKAVAVMACDDEIIPSQERIESITDYADLDDVYSTERHLLYVACTRARDQLLVTSVDPCSEFLDDISV
jgi:superfamily I DNA/RNA helicase/mRNA-degrading endonuclease RelE of RelBE toxin-antitoxin system